MFGLEIIAVIAAVNPAPRLGRGGYLPPVIAAIIELHFLPLAALPRTPVYFLTGALRIAVSLGSLAVGDPARRGV